MPAGGTWTVQNKQRPGAYINFVSVPKMLSVMGDRGVVAIALPMTWGPANTLIEVFGTDLLDGKSLAKIGCTAFDASESLPFRLALAACYKGLFFRADEGGDKASAILSAQLTAVAKYIGTTGNSITVVTTKDKPEAGKYTVDVLFKSVQKESFIVSDLADMEDIESEWVTFVVNGEGEIPVTAGTPLTAGTNGAVANDVYADFFDLITTAQFQCLAIQTDDAAVPALITAKIRSMRDDLGKKVQGVVYNSVAADYEGIISVKQGFKTPTDTVTVSLFPLYVASLTAGAAVNQSRTAFVIPSATEITGYIADNLVADDLKLGWFLISYRQDGAVVIEQDINCLHTFTADKGYAFCKNRVIRCLDEIGNTAALTFNRNYAGKMDNNDTGRNVYKAELISQLDGMQNINAITNFEGPADVIVLPGESIEGVVVDITVQPVDSMEKLYMTVNVNA